MTLVEVVKGRLEVTNTHVYFFDCSTLKDEGIFYFFDKQLGKNFNVSFILKSVGRLMFPLKHFPNPAE